MEDWGAVRDRLADQARDLERRALRERSSAASLVNDHEGAEGAGEEATLYDQLADKLSREAADIRAALDRESDQAQELAEIRLALRKADARDLPLTNVQMIAALRQRVEELEREKYGTPCKCEQWIEACRTECEQWIEACRTAEAKLAELQRSYDFMSGEVYKREQAEAKLARCVEALNYGLLLTASWSDVRTHNWRNGVRAALAAAKGVE